MLIFFTRSASESYICAVGLAGRTSKAMPGEVSLSHNGVLFLDELTEFNRVTLEILRQPLEDRKITITRANYTVEYPCSFMLVAISGPLLDRIDIHCEIQAVPFAQLSQLKPGEPSAVIRERVIRVQ